MRRLVSASYVALLVVVAVAAGVAVVEIHTWNVAVQLGYAGAIARIDVLDLGGQSGAKDDVVDFVDRTGSALAYAPSDGALLTVHDPRGLFRGADGPLFGPLTRAGQEPAALVSDVLQRQGTDLTGVLPTGTRIVGSVGPGVRLAMLESSGLSVVRNLAAGPLGGGTYVIAGPGALEAQELANALSADGASIDGGAVYPPVSWTPFGRQWFATVLAALLGLFFFLGAVRCASCSTWRRSVTGCRSRPCSGLDVGELRWMVWERVGRGWPSAPGPGCSSSHPGRP